ncbi:MAG: imidazole glycerol phosphate synthase subunit HisH [Candidatus Margulisbacteria bacterium]|nr:imidazole glycerol phosphate synthase subunit HisH [Candidatus Margulisiibacteriota bacterium]
MKCGILDYGTGNIQSVQNAIEHIGHRVIRSSQFDELEQADALIFPGQGAFGPAMKTLHRLNLIQPLRQYIESKQPFIGICLGFQLVFDGSDEANDAQGLGCLPGSFKRFESNHLSVPHMGWNQIDATNTGSVLDQFNGQLFYFVHSYYLPIDATTNGATTHYGVPFTSAVANDTQLMTQFHPEKSGDLGLELLTSFLQSVS